MLPFCANLVVSSAAAAPFILYDDEMARREIMKDFEFDQRTRSYQLQQAQDRREIEELRALLNEMEDFQAQDQREIDADTFEVQEQAQAPSASLFFSAPSDQNDFPQSEKHFKSKKRAQRYSEKSKAAEHLTKQIAFAEEQESKRFGNAQDAEQKEEEYVSSLVHRNPRVARKAEQAPQREKARAERQQKKEAAHQQKKEAARRWKEENDRVMQAWLFAGDWHAETENVEPETTETETVEPETTETESSLETCGTSEQSTDTRSSRRATEADLFGMPNLPKRYDPAPRFFPKIAIKNRPRR